MEKSSCEDLFNIMCKFKKLNLGLLIDSVSQGEFFMLSSIDKLCKTEDKLNISFLADVMETSTPSVSRMLSTLEEKKYIKRIPNEKDRRNIYVTLTETGKSIITSEDIKIKNFFEETFEEVGRGRIDEMISICNKIYSVMCCKLNENRK